MFVMHCCVCSFVNHCNCGEPVDNFHLQGIGESEHSVLGSKRVRASVTCRTPRSFSKSFHPGWNRIRTCGVVAHWAVQHILYILLKPRRGLMYVSSSFSTVLKTQCMHKLILQLNSSPFFKQEAEK